MAPSWVSLVLCAASLAVLGSGTARAFRFSFLCMGLAMVGVAGFLGGVAAVPTLVCVVALAGAVIAAGARVDVPCVGRVLVVAAVAWRVFDGFPHRPHGAVDLWDGPSLLSVVACAVAVLMIRGNTR